MRQNSQLATTSATVDRGVFAAMRWPGDAAVFSRVAAAIPQFIIITDYGPISRPANSIITTFMQKLFQWRTSSWISIS